MMNSTFLQFRIISSIVSHNCIFNCEWCVAAHTIDTTSIIVCTRATITTDIYVIGKICSVLALCIVSIWFRRLHQIWIR